MHKSKILMKYAWSMLGTPYYWGGNTVVDGFDCSGFICEVLRPFGLIGNKDDYNSGGLYKKFKNQKPSGIGHLVFFGSSSRNIKHVGLLVDADIMIEAGGGNSTTKTWESAAKRNACVRLRPISYRKDLIEIVEI